MTQETKNKIKLQNQNKIKDDEERNVREWSKHLHYLMDIYNKEQNSVDNILEIVGQRKEQDEITHSKNYQHNYQPPHKRYHTRKWLIWHIFN